MAGHFWKPRFKRLEPFRTEAFCAHCGADYETEYNSDCRPKPATPEPKPTRNYYLEARQRVIDALNARDLAYYRGTLTEEGKAELRKPATPEPPEWKATSMSLCMNCGQSHLTGDPCSFCKPPGFTSRAPRECDRCGAIYTLAECSCSVLRPDYTPGTVTNTGVVQTDAPAQDRLDRALSDFIAKRKAKRDAATEWLEAREAERHKKTRPSPLAPHSKPIARAFSLPLTFTARLGMKQP